MKIDTSQWTGQSRIGNVEISSGELVLQMALTDSCDYSLEDVTQIIRCGSSQLIVPFKRNIHGNRS
jgi:hypothetical protein